MEQATMGEANVMNPNLAGRGALAGAQQEQYAVAREPSLSETIDRLVKANEEAASRVDLAERLADELCGPTPNRCVSGTTEATPSTAGLVDRLRRELDRSASIGMRLSAALNRIRLRLSPNADAARVGSADIAG